MFNAIVEEEEENAEVEVDDEKSKELKEKLAQSIDELKTELKETLAESLSAIAADGSEPNKEKKSIWGIALFGVTFSVSLLFSMLMSVFVYFNAILGIFPGGLLGTSNFGDKLYYYVFFEKILGTYPDSTAFVRPTWELAGSLTLQDFILLILSGLFLVVTFIKLELRGFRLFSKGEAVENASEGTEDAFMTSKVLVFIILIMYILTIIGALTIDHRVDEDDTFTLAPGEDYVIQLDNVHTISWQTKVVDIGENSTYSVVVLSESQCERYESGNSYIVEDMFSKEQLVSSSGIDPKRESSTGNYCIALSSDEGSESTMTIRYQVQAS